MRSSAPIPHPAAVGALAYGPLSPCSYSSALFGLEGHLATGFSAYGWHETSGTVLSSGVKRNFSTSTGGRDTFEAEITYRYQVNGQEYTSNVISPGPELASNTNRASTKLRRLIKMGRWRSIIIPPTMAKRCLNRALARARCSPLSFLLSSS